MSKTSFLQDLPKPFFVLAPMYDVTDTVFRRVIAQTAPPDLYFTEFVNVDGLQSAGRDKIIHRLKFTSDEQPIIAQIWGKNPENYRKTARELVEMGFVGVDINMGCPDKAVLKNGCCGALINDHDLAKAIIDATKEGTGGNVPVSVKTRIGFRGYDQEWLKFLLEQNLDMLSVHLRTVREMSKVPAHHELLAEILQLRNKISHKTLLVANGDIETRSSGKELAKDYGVDGLMIGRGVFHDPYALSQKSPWESMEPAQKLKIYIDHVKLFAQTWKNGEYPVVVLNKFCKIYINGFDGAKEIREELMSAKSIQELQSKLENTKLAS